VPISILKERNNLIVSLHTSPTDAEWLRLRDDLLNQIGRFRSEGVIIDDSGLDVMDSFATRLLHGIARACRLRGAETVIVGIRPEVALTMVQLGWTARLAGIVTALDLEDALALLAQPPQDQRGVND
jgi:rsbT antagonist protein RsbS